MAKDAVKSVEDLQRELLETQLETAKIGQEEARENNARHRERKLKAAENNRQLQADYRQKARNQRANEMACAHASGGEAGGNPLEGGGKYSHSVITRTLMPDGVTELLLCLRRCGLKLFGRERSPREEAQMEAAAEKARKLRMAHDPVPLEMSKPEQIWDDHQRWKKLRQTSMKEGIPNNLLRGPTFMFKDENGIGFIPELR